jgi:16S rRNA (guanine966-N2)-methyltransferase
MEAASRGAAEVVMVESNRAVFRALQENSKKLKLENITLRNEDGLSFASRGKGQFDVIFLDPPFQSDYLEKLMPLLASQLTPEGLLYVESGSAFAAGEAWQVYKQGRAGAVHFQLLQPLRHD